MIVFLDVDTEDHALVSGHFPDAVIHPAGLTGDALIEACKDASVVSCFIHTRFDEAVLTQLPALKLLVTRSVGYDHIDIDYCDAHNIVVCNVPDYGSHVIAEHVFALLLGTLRHIHEGDKRVREGVFNYHGLRGMALREKTIGIVGTGKIGRKVARIAHGFGMHILAVDICRILDLTKEYGVQYVELPELLAKSDIVTLHVPSLPDTQHMINTETIAQMKDGVILVNTARGSLIDTPALIAALDSGKIRMALLDVLEHEADVHADDSLVRHPKVVTTPHIAFYADDSVHAMYTDAFASIDQWLENAKPLHTVKPVQVVCETKQ